MQCHNCNQLLIAAADNARGVCSSLEDADHLEVMRAYSGPLDPETECWLMDAAASGNWQRVCHLLMQQCQRCSFSATFRGFQHVDYWQAIMSNMPCCIDEMQNLQCGACPF